MKRYRIGVMGCAAIAERSVIPAIRSLPGWELAAAASRSRDTAQRFAARCGCEAVVGYDALLDREDIDAIYMPLPAGLHEHWVMRCLEAGKHVLAEKPLACDHGGAMRMVEKAAAANLLLMENFMFAYHAQHRLVRELLADGRIGEIRLLRSSFGFPPLSGDNFRYKKELGGGALLDAGGYPVKASQMYLGRGLEVTAANLRVDPERKVDMYGSAYLVSPAGVVSEIAFGFDNYYQCNIEFWGSKGKLVAGRAFTPPPGFAAKVVLETSDSRREITVAPDNHFVNILIEFRRAIDEGDHGEHLQAALEQARLVDEIRNRADGTH